MDTPLDIQRSVFPRDCINHVLTFCDPSTTSNAYLVSRSWYHAVDRYVCMADQMYQMPEHVELRRRRWFPSTSLPTFEDDARYRMTNVIYLQMTEDNTIPVSVWPQYLNLCPSLHGVIVEVSANIPIENCEGFQNLTHLVDLNLSGTNVSDVSSLSGCRALRKLDVSSCAVLTDTGIRGLELIPTLEQ
eukprot:PhF_6_TR9169/c2_g6_i1/m.14268